MIKHLPIKPINDEEQLQNQMYSWLNDSHYWIQQNDYSFICKWCGIYMPCMSIQSTLCVGNPELLKLNIRIKDKF
jgi:hypothetical protein